MKLKRRRIIQIAITALVIINCIMYFFYINGYLNFKGLSIGDLNPYGGWSALKSIFTDLSYRWTGISKSIALTIGIIITSLFFGRFFCGFICPIGSLQDFFKFIGRKLEIKEKRLGRFFKGEIIKYFVLMFLLILSILGLGNVISPYSTWLAYLNLFLGKIQLGFLVLLLVIVLSLFMSRMFCRIICPVGAFQSLLYAIGPLKIITTKDCNECIYCLIKCPVDIEKPQEDEITPECINCLECIETKCIKNTAGYSLRFGKYKIQPKQYIATCLILFLSIYILLPLLGSNNDLLYIGDIGILKDGSFTGIGIGFGGQIQVEVKIEDEKIIDIKSINHNETKGYYEEVFRNISREIVETQSIKIDTISGATATSRGFLSAIKSGLSQALEKQ